MRKLTIATVVLLCLGMTAHSQIKKGSLFLGGSVGFGNNTNKTTNNQPPLTMQENNSKNWSINPQIGTAIADNRVVGLFFSFSKSKEEQKSGANTNVNESRNLGAGIFYRRYYPMGTRFYLFGEADLGYSGGKLEVTNTSGTTQYVSFRRNSKGINLGITPGLSFAAGRKVFLEASLNSLLALNYTWSEGKNFDPRGVELSVNKGKSFSGGANANGFSGLSVGLRWILPQKK